MKKLPYEEIYQNPAKLAEELERRRAAWQCPEPKIKTGYLARDARMVSSADRGAVLD